MIVSKNFIWMGGFLKNMIKLHENDMVEIKQTIIKAISNSHVIIVIYEYKNKYYLRQRETDSDYFRIEYEEGSPTILWVSPPPQKMKMLNGSIEITKTLYDDLIKMNE